MATKKLKEGKDINRILNSRNRKAKSDNEEDELEDIDPDDEEIEDERDSDDNESEDTSDDEKFIKSYRGYDINYSRSMNYYFALKNGDVEFSDDNLEYLEEQIDDFLSEFEPAKPANTSGCIYCKSGICKNDESIWYYNQECPGGCDEFYR